MTPDFLIEFAKMALPAAAAFVSVRVTLAIALERAENALNVAERAHTRIDKMLEK